MEKPAGSGDRGCSTQQQPGKSWPAIAWPPMPNRDKLQALSSLIRTRLAISPSSITPGGVAYLPVAVAARILSAMIWIETGWPKMEREHLHNVATTTSVGPALAPSLVAAQSAGTRRQVPRLRLERNCQCFVLPCSSTRIICRKTGHRLAP